MITNTVRRVATLVTSTIASTKVAGPFSGLRERVVAVSSRATVHAKIIITRLGLLTLVTVLLVPSRVAAQAESRACGDIPEQFQAIAELLTRIQQLGVALGLLIAALMYVWAGILWMRGTPDSQQRARRIFFNTSVGLVLILIAGGLVEFVKSVLCGGG